MSRLHFKNVEAGGVNVSYIESGSHDLPTLLLLHGFPSSAVQYAGLIPLLSSSYHIIAPTFPGFGETVAPDNFSYTFDSLKKVLSKFLTVLKITHFAVYIFDYGAPVLLRLAIDPPPNFSIAAIISQNGNAYVDGLGKDFWAPIERYWKSGSAKDRETLRKQILTLETTEYQYREGVPESKQSLINPADYTLDYLQNEAPASGRQDAQLDLFYDYRKNVELYPDFQAWFRRTQVPLLAVWGKGDPAFIPAGALAYKTDLPHAKVRFVDSGHFALTTDADVIAREIKVFLTSINY